MHVANTTFSFVRIDFLHQLNFKSKSCKSRTEFKQQPVLKVYLNRKARFENDLNINGLLELFPSVRIILFQNINGFDQKQASNTEILDFQGEYDFINVNFEFYQNETLITEDKCKSEYFKLNMRSFFSDMQYVSLSDNVLYSQKVCPYVFINANILYLRLLEITNSLIFMNRLEFISINNTESYNLGTNSIESFEMNLAYETVSLNNLNKHVFKR